MARYHISKDGVPRVCRAQVQCRLGGETDHFDSKDEALRVTLARELESQGGIAPPAQEEAEGAHDTRGGKKIPQGAHR